MTTDPDLLWSPSRDQAENSRRLRVLRWLDATHGLRFADYPELWRWSTTDLPGFWSAVWEFYGLETVSGYDEVLADATMPGASWFPGARINFAERFLARATDERPALVGVVEDGTPTELSWEELRRQVATVAEALRRMGVLPGDCVAGYLPQPAAGGDRAAGRRLRRGRVDVLLARLRHTERPRPAAPGPAHGPGGRGRVPLGRQEVRQTRGGRRDSGRTAYAASSPGRGAPVRHRRPDVGDGPAGRRPALLVDAAVSRGATGFFADVPFDHPLWILWSSGTTGVPKGIVQGHGGITVELLKALGLGADLRPEDRYLFVTSTSWMVWNFLVGGLLLGCARSSSTTAARPPRRRRRLAGRRAHRRHRGRRRRGLPHRRADADARPAEDLDLSRLRTILQTGSALPPTTWRWAHDRFPGVWLQPICGGTDVCSVLAGGSALLPVHVGRLQAPALGVALAAWDPDGRPLTGEQGELVVTAPMPSMPLHFVNDPDGDRYRAAYFDTYPGVWRHGDWVTVHPDLSVTVSGRSDSTLNRMGVRMGSADIYAVVEQLPEIADSLVLGVELPDGGYSMPLFVVTAADSPLDDELRARIKAAIRRELSPRHVPDTVVRIAAVPRTLTGKKLEVPVKHILQGADVARVSSSGAVTHPEMLDWFAAYASHATSTACGVQ